MDKYITAEVPFRKLGNYSYLTDQQLVEQPWLEEFVNKFKHCFVRDNLGQVWLYIPTA